MAQAPGTTAASAELTGAGTITGFSSAQTSGVLVAVVFCSGTETSSGAFTMGGGGLTWGFVAAFLSGVGGVNPAVQSIFVFSAPFSSAVSSQTFTLTPHSPVSGHFGFVLVECEGSKNTFEPSLPSISSLNSTSISLQAANTTLTSAGAAGGQPVVVVGNANGFGAGSQVLLNQPGTSQSEVLTIQSVAAGALTMTTNLVNTYLNVNGPTSVILLCVTANANDMVLGCIVDEAGGTDTIVGAGGYTTAITTQNFKANVGAACGVIYKVVSTTSQQNNPSATTTNGGPTALLAIAIEAAGGASAQAIVIS